MEMQSRVHAKNLVAWAKSSGAYLVNDAAYAEVVFEGASSPSILSAPGAKQVAVEFHSLSKTFNMTGWRAGFAVGELPVKARGRGALLERTC